MKIRKLHIDTASIAFAGLQITDPRVSVVEFDGVMDTWEGEEHCLLFTSTISEYKHLSSSQPECLSGFHSNRIIVLVPEEVWSDSNEIQSAVSGILSGEDSEVWIISSYRSFE